MQKTKATQTSEFKTKVSAKAKTLTAAGSADFGVSVSDGSSLSTNQLHATTITQGGDSTIWLKVTENNFDQVMEEWAASVDDSNLFPIRMQFKPIWDLLKELDMKKGRALELYIKNIWAAEKKKLDSLDSAPYAEPKLKSINNGTECEWEWDNSGWWGGTSARVDKPKTKYNYADSDTYYPIGDVFTAGTMDKPYCGALPLFAGDIRHPKDWDFIWDDHGTYGTYDAKMWNPKPEYGYKCVASALTDSLDKPSSDDYACFPSDCVVGVDSSKPLWADHGSGSYMDLTVFQSPEGYLNVHYFVAVSGYPEKTTIGYLKDACFE